MQHRTLLLFCSLMLVACSQQPAQLVLTAQSYGDVQFGTPLEEIETKLQQLAEPKIPAESCSYVTFANYADIRFMVEDGVVTRADAGESIANETGFSAGTNSADLLKANPQMKITPHKYEPESRYLILATPDGNNALVFEESGGLITKVRAGTEPAVEYVEGCG
ncbi:MAG: hypothetical protein V4628_01230 [Pseudomonadota bacterium]